LRNETSLLYEIVYAYGCEVGSGGSGGGPREPDAERSIARSCPSPCDRFPQGGERLTPGSIGTEIGDRRTVRVLQRSDLCVEAIRNNRDVTSPPLAEVSSPRWGRHHKFGRNTRDSALE